MEIRIRMLGQFSLETDTVRISDANKRSRKSWGLLAYLICSRRSTVNQKQLLELLYGEDSDSVNPENALRITMHRVRGILNELWPGAGMELVVHKNGCYQWNAGQQITLDCEQFEQLTAPCPEQDRLPRLLEALALYQGDFLPRQEGENWAIPVTAHYHNRFVEVSQEAAKLLVDQGRYEEAVEICRRAVETEPYHEPLHQLLIQALGAKGDAKGAAACYERLRKRLFDDFGIHPNEQTRQIYRKSAHSPEDRTLEMDEVLEQLKEPDSKHGALVCDYDYFKFLCYTQSRTIERSGHAAHVALMNLVSSSDVPLSRRTQNRLAEQLGEHIRLNLRRGDTVSQCSPTQYIMMLPRANYENSCMVCRRIISSFQRAHPKAAVTLNYMVQPLAPGISVP